MRAIVAEWLFEDGIGEARAALVEDGRIIAARIELPGLRLGSVVAGRLMPGRRVRLEGGMEVVLEGPVAVSEGAAVHLLITREVIPEPGRAKPPRGTITDAPLAPGRDLRARLAATGQPVRLCQPHAPDALEAAGWSDVLEEARTGDIAFAGGMLRMVATPAMTLFDVDGDGPLDALALAAAGAVAAAIVRHDIGGSIGVDFPTITGKAARVAVAAAIDAALPQPFERTALNGFGFLQIVRPRPRASLPELLHADAGAAAARALLRRMERTPAGAPAEPVPAPIARHITPAWRDALARRTGRDWSF